VEIDQGSSGAAVAHVRDQFAEVRARVCGKLVASMAQVVKVNAGQAHDGKGGRQQPDTKIPEAQLREAERQAVGIWHDFRSRPGCLGGHHGPVEMVTVRRENDGLRFSDVKRGPDGVIWHVWVRLRVGGLDASWPVSPHYATNFDELTGFFCGLAADWRGWSGKRTYESLEHDLRLTAAHDGHVRLAV
jgi:hypothetical protein